MKKILSLALAAVLLLTLVGGTAQVARAEAFDAASVIAGFNTFPTKVNATFTQTYVLDVQNDDYQSFAKDEADVVTVSMDLTPGDVYYYGKLVEKDGTVTEQLVCAEDGTYYASATTVEKIALPDEATAVGAIYDMMKNLSRKTAGYVDPGFFTYTGNAWMTAYILLGSTNVEPDDFWFTYTYTDNNGGVNASITADYIGYFGDMGTFEFPKQPEAEHAGVIELSTDANGYITSFNEKMTSALSLPIISPPVPLVLNGERTLTAVYGEDVERISALGETAAPAPAVEAAPEQAPEAGEAASIVLGTVEGCTVATYDFDYATFAFVEGNTVAPGHFVAFQVTAPEGAEVAATVNGEEVAFINGYYCYMTPAEAGKEYVVSATVGAAAEAASAENGTIVLGTAVNCSVVTYDFDYATFAFVEGTEVAPGHFVAFQVTAPEGAEIAATVNGEEVAFINGYYCYMTPAEAGKEYVVSVSAGGDAAPAMIPVKVYANSHAVIEVYDFVQGDYSTLAQQCEAVTVGNFLAVKVTPDEGYTLAHVRVNSKSVDESMCFGGYWCVPAVEGINSFAVKALLK